MTLFRCQIYLAGQRPTNWGHHLYHSKSKVDGDFSPDRHTHINTDMSVFEGLRFNVLISRRRENLTVFRC